MQRINMTHPGGVDVLYIEDAALPAPEAGELLIKTAYAGVNRPDIMQREGVYPMPAGVTPIMGLEFSGEVVALGAGVSGIAVGDSVCALTDDGAYAEYYVVKASQTLPLRAGYSLQEAAMLPETAFTVWQTFSCTARCAPAKPCWYMAAPAASASPRSPSHERSASPGQ